MPANKYVIKRDGSVVPFLTNKIFNAIQASSLPDTPHFHIQNICDYIIRDLFKTGNDKFTVVDIQKKIEDYLMTVDSDHARRYIEYRYSRDVSRETKSSMFSDIIGLINQDREDILNENANKAAERIPTQRDLLAGIVSRHYGMDHILPSDVATAHINGDIHFHDSDYSPLFPMTNCCLVDLENMLSNGFKMGTVDIEPPKSFTTAIAVSAQIIAQVASHMYGGTTYNRFDEVLAPYAEKSYLKHLNTGKMFEVADPEDYAFKLTCKEIYDGCQGLELTI